MTKENYASGGTLKTGVERRTNEVNRKILSFIFIIKATQTNQHDMTFLTEHGKVVEAV